MFVKRGINFDIIMAMLENSSTNRAKYIGARDVFNLPVNIEPWTTAKPEFQLGAKTKLGSFLAGLTVLSP